MFVQINTNVNYYKVLISLISKKFSKRYSMEMEMTVDTKNGWYHNLLSKGNKVHPDHELVSEIPSHDT